MLPRNARDLRVATPVAAVATETGLVEILLPFGHEGRVRGRLVHHLLGGIKKHHAHFFVAAHRLDHAFHEFIAAAPVSELAQLL
ncbi:hypothetical protein D3C71_1849350 [compost metagenome]